MKIKFLGTSLDDIRAFPKDVAQAVGHQLQQVQRGLPPINWKPVSTVGSGVKEIRQNGKSGAFRVFYVVSRKGKVLVLHAFQKTTQKTEKRDIELAKARFKKLE